MHLYEVKECLCDTPGVCLHACEVRVRVHHIGDQNVQFLGLDQFLINYKG